MRRLVLVRHAEPEGHAGRCVGQHDTELSRHGIAAALALGEMWREVGGSPVLVTSDLRRAASTANALAKAWGLEARVDARLRELSFGDWDGVLWKDVSLRDAERLRAWGDDWIAVAPPGGESGRDLARRVEAALHDLIALTKSERPVVAVTHAGWIRIATTLLLGEPMSAAFTRDVGYARGAAFRIDPIEAVRGELLAWDATELF